MTGLRWFATLALVLGAGCRASPGEHVRAATVHPTPRPLASTPADKTPSPPEGAEPTTKPPEPVVDLAAGWDFTCARFASGKVRCWGDNAYGQLGNRRRGPGDILESGGTKCGSCMLTPAEVYSIDDARQLVAGSLTACAVVADGTVKCWGLLNHAASTAHGFVPTTVPGLDNVSEVAMATGSHNACARRVDGSVKCWGHNTYGELGDGTTKPRATPVDVPAFKDAEQIAMGDAHTCARFADGAVKCVGVNHAVGGTATTNSAGVAFATVPLKAVTAIAGAWNSSCAVTADAHVWCWGENFNGQLGDGTEKARARPVQSLFDVGAKSLAMSGGTCALGVDGHAYCWGSNGAGQVGDGTLTTRLAPTKVTDQNVTASFRKIAVGRSHACGLLADGKVVCWGSNAVGELGATTWKKYRAFPRSVEW